MLMLFDSCGFLDITKKYDRSFERYKVRLIGDGESQQVDIDCGETYSPIFKLTTTHTILSIALSKS